MSLEGDAAKLELGKEFKDAECLLDSEVELILSKRKEQILSFSDDYKLSDVFEKTLSHVQKFSRYKNKSAVKEVRSMLEQKGKFYSFEIACLANLMPLSSEEAFALIPSLQRPEIEDDIEDLNRTLDELQNCCQTFN